MPRASAPWLLQTGRKRSSALDLGLIGFYPLVSSSSQICPKNRLLDISAFLEPFITIRHFDKVQSFHSFTGFGSSDMELEGARDFMHQMQ